MKRTLAVLLVGIWAGAIFATSSTVVRPNEFISFVSQYILTSEEALERFQAFWGTAWIFVVKGWHFVEFALLQFLTAHLFEALAGRRSQSMVFWSALICCAFAASDEWHQSFIPHRYGTTWDVFVDCLGVMTMAWFMIRARQSR